MFIQIYQKKVLTWTPRVLQSASIDQFFFIHVCENLLDKSTVGRPFSCIPNHRPMPIGRSDKGEEGKY